MLRIVHVDTGRELRGGQRQLLRLARGLRERGHRQLVVCPDGSALEWSAREEGFQVFDLPGHDLGRLNGILQLRQKLLAEPSQILHAHDGRGQTISWLASLGLPVRRVASRRVTFLPEGVGRHRFIYTTTCHAVIAVSHFVRSMLLKAGVPGERIEVIQDGIEIPAQLPTPAERAAARARWNFGEQEFLVGHVGAFTPEKGQDVAVEAMRLLDDRLPNSRLVLVGNAPQDFRETLDGLPPAAAGRIKLLGELEDLSEFFAALDLFIMPSRAEGLGSAALLAMARGRAVVASRVGGLPEIVDAGRSGWLVEPGSARELADAIFDAASDPVRLAKFGALARDRACHFSNDIMVAKTEALYERLLNH
ncbi:MAG: glycosyltransferase family 4 protein [Terriglobia bacterium]